MIQLILQNTLSKKEKLKDFRRPIMDPSLDECGNITFKKDSIPFTLENYNTSPKEIKLKVKSFMPTKNSRLGTIDEYFVFLVFLMKYLVNEKKYSVINAIYYVCENSSKLVSNSTKTGQQKIGNFYDLLTNNSKLLDFSPRNGYGPIVYHYAAGINTHPYNHHWGDFAPLSYVYSKTHFNGSNSVPWIVMDV